MNIKERNKGKILIECIDKQKYTNILKQMEKIRIFQNLIFKIKTWEEIYKHLIL